MLTLFHNQETDQTVSFEEKDGAFTVEFQKGRNADIEAELGRANPKYRSISREDLAITKYPVYVLDSVKAGKGTPEHEKGLYARVIEPIFSRLLGIKATYVQTTSASSIAEFAASLEPPEKKAVIVILGGDTSVNEFLNGLPDIPRLADIFVSVVPTGTGNALALALELNDIQSALRKLFTCTEYGGTSAKVFSASLPPGTKKIFRGEEVGDAPQKYYFVVVFSWAFHASLVADSDTEELRQHGNERFKIAAQQNLQAPQKYSGSYTTHQKIKGPFSYFVATPVQDFEPGFRISPDGNISDSDFHVVSVGYEHEEEPTGKYLYDIMLEAYDGGKHIKNPKVDYHRVGESDSLVLEVDESNTDKHRRFCVDGAIIQLPGGKKSSIEIKYEGFKVGRWTLQWLA